MAKFTDYFKVITPQPAVTTMADSQGIGDQGAYANYTWYQRLVQGAASRITRYREYDMMENDVEVARALDIIAEEMTRIDQDDEMPLRLVIQGDKEANIPPSTVTTLRVALRYWVDIHDFRTRLFQISRVTAKYGDCFFLRKKETMKWEYIHPKNIVAAIVDQRDITKVLGWQVRRDIKAPNSPYNAAPTGGMYGSQSNDQLETVPADDMIWFTRNDDMSESAPFGESVLRAVYRAQKQKELLEDAIIIYRIQRAPERRVFKVNVGKMPAHRVKSYMEQLKNEIRQKKIPTYGGGTDQVDSVYNPHSMSEDFWFPTRPDGTGSSVEVLPGGQNLGELNDLEYFQWKVFRGLRIPLSYMREGQDGGTVNDGQPGLAYIQEYTFAKYCTRLQSFINKVVDKEFKRYLRTAGISIDPTIFKVALMEPENFGTYRQQKRDTELLNTLSTAAGVEFIAKRTALSKFGQFTDEEVIENQRKLCEERGLDPDSTDIKQLALLYGPQPDPSMAPMGGGGGGMMAGTMGPDMGMSGDMGMPGADGGQAGGAGMAPAAGGQPAAPAGNAPLPQ